MEASYLSAILLLSEQDDAVVRACSEAVSAGRPAPSRLDDTHVPHLTVARFEAPRGEAPLLSKEMQRRSRMLDTLTSEGLCFSPYSNGGKIWVMLQFKRSNWLDELQQALISGDFAHDHRVDNKTGEAYNPHVTLALLEGTATPSVNLGGFSLFRRGFNGFRLAVGVNGAYLAVTEIL